MPRADARGRPKQAVPGVAQDHVGRQRNEAARNAECNGGCASDAWVGFFQPEFESHHKIHPFFRTLAQSRDHGLGFCLGQAILLEQFLGAAFSASGISTIVPRCSRCFPPERNVRHRPWRPDGRQAHGDGAGRDFRQTDHRSSASNFAGLTGRRRAQIAR